MTHKDRIRVGDKVFYRAPRIKDRKRAPAEAVLTVTRLYYGGTMAEVLHDAGYTYKGYIVANMSKA